MKKIRHAVASGGICEVCKGLPLDMSELPKTRETHLICSSNVKEFYRRLKSELKSTQKINITVDRDKNVIVNDSLEADLFAASREFLWITTFCQSSSPMISALDVSNDFCSAEITLMISALQKSSCNSCRGCEICFQCRQK